MRILLAVTIFLVAGTVSAQDYRNYYRNNDAYELNRSLDNIAWEIRMLRYDIEYTPSYGGSYYPVYQPVSKACQKKMDKYAARLMRAQASRAAKQAAYAARRAASKE